ncbi:hypothetical protein [Sphingobium phenoxybenzoativorans]|uniref:hypothetical protein n=1 Tax=Sphingobium phenoxybenzoativorans TaxID=1592790 RepID=UPI000871E669|nr:hypothetical protein [Sphingobium phenoxybenzoativorans]
MHRWTILAASLVTLAHPAAALAQQPVTLSSNVFVEKVSNDLNGGERRVLAAPGQLGQGDRLVFVLRYRNDGPAPVSRFAVTNPVPQSVRIDTARQDMQVSVDGGRNWGRLDKLQLRTPFGGTRRATADDITHVRWTVNSPVSPGATGQIAYRGVVR